MVSGEELIARSQDLIAAFDPPCRTPAGLMEHAHVFAGVGRAHRAMGMHEVNILQQERRLKNIPG